MTDPVAKALELAAHTGSIRTHGPGRTDTEDIAVPAESFVVPADVVSALGEGNTANGFRILETMFPPKRTARASGGAVPIVAAGGEFVVGPEHVAQIGKGDLKKGHEALREFSSIIRKRAIKTLRKLPKPVRG